MKLYNETKNCFVSEEVLLADRMLKRLKGLLGRDGLEEGCSMLIKPCNSIHTFFMRFSIDAVFIDRNYKVLKVLRSLAPGKASPIVPGARGVIEFETRASQRLDIDEGDRLALVR